MGCDLSNAINENAQRGVYPAVVHPDDHYSHQNQNGIQNFHNHQYAGSVQHQNGYQNPQYPQHPQYNPAYQQVNPQPVQYVPIPNQGINYDKQNVTQMYGMKKNQNEQKIEVKKNNTSEKQNKIPLQQKTEEKIKPRPQNRRGIMPLHINKKEDFVTHHLKGQVHLCKYARANFIKRRQILEHQKYQEVLERGCSKNHSHLNQFATKAHYQRVMLEIFETADKQFFEEGKSYDEVRQKVAQRYLFEIFQNKEFLDASFGRYASFFPMTQMPMSYTALASDSALFPILRYLKEKYPQVADKTSIKFPEVKERKNDINLLDNFPSRSYSSQGLINVQTLLSDLKFLIDRSVQEFADFQSDMKALMGDDVLTDSKVKRVTKNGVEQYSASPVRRVFIKWAQTIIERVPDIIVSEAFLEFVRSKSLIVDNFYFKSTVQPTTHGIVIKHICELLEAAKYEITSLAKRKQFGFYVYDLLRCKTKRKTGEQVVQLLNKLETTKTTPSGKKFEVVRIKDRFKTPNRDLMVNFKYGDVIVGQAQLCIDTSNVSEKIKKTNKFNHYIYELERGLFGPTCELIMQYEDFHRQDISANLQAQGLSHKRVSKKPIEYIKKAGLKCFNNHEMIELQGNQFVKGEAGTYEQQPFYCDFCETNFGSENKYYYCYFCTLVFCKGCQSEYKTVPTKQIQNRCNREDLIPQLKTQQQIKSIISKTPIVVFYLNKGDASTIFKDFLVYFAAINKLQKKQFPPLYGFCCDSKTSSSFFEKYNIKQFPTTIVFSSDGTPQSKLIGSSWQMIEGLFEIQKQLSHRQPKALEIKCFCGELYSEVQLEEGMEINCLNCNNASLSEGFLGGLLSDNSRGFFCVNGHSRCQNCAFLAVNQPSSFKDFRGRSYLTDKIQEPKLPKCNSGHQTIYLKSIEPAKEFQCLKCTKKFMFNSIYGAGCCQPCQAYCCPKCIGIKDEDSKHSENDLATHTIQATAQQGEKCVCGKLFKKVYNTRDHSINTAANEGEEYDNIVFIPEKVYSNEIRTWTCILCQQQKKDGQLHLACFRCPMISEGEKNPNIQICIKCAIISDFLNRQLQPKITELQTTFVCKSKHPVVKTKLAYNNEEMTYDCTGCRKTFYIYTQRYHCKTCRTNFCQECQRSNLTNTNPPPCLRNCNESHQLQLQNDPKGLKICRACSVVIRKTHYQCPKFCEFELCLQCAASDPCVDTKKRREESIDHEVLNKKIQDYEKGYFDLDDVMEIADNLGLGDVGLRQAVDQVGNAIGNVMDFFND